MNRNSNAIVRWTPEKRPLIRHGLTYTTACRLVGSSEGFDNPWSMVVEVSPTIMQDPLETYARVRFLFENAPSHLMVKGAEFELYEGRRITGLVTITE